MLAFRLRRRELSPKQQPTATPQAGGQCSSFCSDASPRKVPAHLPCDAGRGECATSADTTECAAEADSALDCTAAEDSSAVATLGSSLGSALGGALSLTLNRLEATESATPSCDVEDAAEDAQPCLLHQRVAAAAPLLARAVGSVLASHALLPPPFPATCEGHTAVSGSGLSAAFAVADGRRFVDRFCRAFEAAAWRLEGDTLCTSAAVLGSLSCEAQSLRTRESLQLPADASMLALHLLSVAAGDIDATPAQVAAIQAVISLQCNDLARQHLGTARVAASAALRGAAAHEEVAATSAARRRDSALQRAAADALACAVLVAAASLASRVQTVAAALPSRLRRCAAEAGLPRCVKGRIWLACSVILTSRKQALVGGACFAVDAGGCCELRPCRARALMWRGRGARGCAGCCCATRCRRAGACSRSGCWSESDCVAGCVCRADLGRRRGDKCARGECRRVGLVLGAAVRLPRGAARRRRQCCRAVPGAR